MRGEGVIYARLAAIALACALSAWAGWEWRDRSCDVAALTVERDGAKAATKAVTDAREADHGGQAAATEVEAERVQQQQGTEAAFRIIYRDVIRYVDSNPVRPGCGIGPDGMRLWRAANAGIAPETESDPAPLAAGAVPAGDGGRAGQR